jgi:hypothetical protein
MPNCGTVCLPRINRSVSFIRNIQAKNEDAHSLIFATQPGLAKLTSSLRTRSIGGKPPDDIPGWGLPLFAAFSSCIQV